MTTAKTAVVLELTEKEAKFLASFLMQGVEWAYGVGEIAEDIYNALADGANIEDEGDYDFEVSGAWLRAKAV